MPDASLPDDVPPDVPAPYAEAYRRAYEQAVQEHEAQQAAREQTVEEDTTHEEGDGSSGAEPDRRCWLLLGIMVAMVVVVLVGAYLLGTALKG